jgi:hypothetical protein
MEIKRPRSWQGFKKIIEEIRVQYGSHTINLSSGKDHTRRNKILFRGQGNAKWELKTTLERVTSERLSVLQYWVHATSGSNEIESLTGTDWKLKHFPEVKEEIEKTHDSFRITLPSYDYLVYLRHHGFPSPLLDWTESPYIAAFFAYSAAESSNSAVYCYIETPEGGKGHTSYDPFIQVMGPYVTTHKRHFAQKAWYTVSSEWDEDNKCLFFCNHEKVFKLNSPNQDVLIKIVLPSKLRIEVLNELNDYNINYFTLFQSEDSLIQSIAMREFLLKKV